jgi:hypothetical protein
MGEPLAKVSCSVIPAKAGIQNCLNPADGGIPGRASRSWNDDFLSGPEFCKSLRYYLENSQKCDFHGSRVAKRPWEISLVLILLESLIAGQRRGSWT